MKPVVTLGISAFYHDAAAAIVRDGDIVAAAQEERFSRKKHDPRFPHAAIDYCLEEAFVDPAELDAAVFYDNPVLTTDRMLSSLLAVAPRGEEQWLQAARSVLGIKVHAARLIEDALGADVPVLFTQHHLAHAASAFYPSPFQRAAILTMDGVGEWATSSVGRGSRETIELVDEIHYPHSLGLLYSALTHYCGFKVNSGEYKLMGLAPYGEPRYASAMREHLIELKPDGSFRLNTEHFAFLDTERITDDRFAALFGGPARTADSPITARETDLAASVQVVLEEAVIGLARRAVEVAETPDLVMAGGVALNCVANARVLAEPGIHRVWVQPAAGDAGGAIGAALLAAYLRFGVRRVVDPEGKDAQHGSFLGPSYSSAEVRAFLDSGGYPYEVVADRSIRAKRIARALADGKTVGHFSGRMEFGPRALGARSILADPRSPTMQARLNRNIKEREGFRPFAPSVLADRAADYFDLDAESPYMLLVAPVVASRRIDRDTAGDDVDPVAAAAVVRSDIPAVTHVDYSARLQTVMPDAHPDYHAVLRAFEAETGCGVLVNTSFNVRGEPIVCSPADAYRCFMRTGIDLLVLEDCVLEHSAQPEFSEPDQQYEPD